MDTSRKKELIYAYKQKERIGGIYEIYCTINKKRWIESTIDVAGSKNRFDFSQHTDSCIFTVLQKDWETYGADSFAFQILDTLKQKEEQSLSQFKEDLVTLKECLCGEYSSKELYN